jgi:hypothetical protein
MLFAAVPGQAADHLVTSDTLQARLAQKAQDRASDRAAVANLLDSEAGRLAAARLHADPERLKDRLSLLSDDELKDIATRATALQSDPVAGLSNDVETLLIIFLVVGLVILVIQAVD